MAKSKTKPTSKRPAKSPVIQLPKKIKILIAGVCLLLVGLIIVSLVAVIEHKTEVKQQTKIRNFISGNVPIADIPNFAHIFVILEENDSDDVILGNPQASYINDLSARYSLATNYKAIAHPSLPNYLAITGGSTYGVTTDCQAVGDNSCSVDAPSLMDEIERSGRTWKAYFESIPEPCAVESTDLYSVYTNPFIYHDNILNNKQRCDNHIVPYSQLNTDLSPSDGTLPGLPDFIFIVPNLCDNSHNCPITVADEWLASTVTGLLDSPAFTQENSLLAITWDESSPPDNPNYDVPLILAGPQVRRSYKSAKNYSHYSLLHTIEKAWSLPPLTKNDANAPLLQEFFVP